MIVLSRSKNAADRSWTRPGTADRGCRPCLHGRCRDPRGPPIVHSRGRCVPRPQDPPRGRLGVLGARQHRGHDRTAVRHRRRVPARRAAPPRGRGGHHARRGARRPARRCARGSRRRWCWWARTSRCRWRAPHRRAATRVLVVLARPCPTASSGRRWRWAPRASPSCPGRRAGWSSGSPTSVDAGPARGLTIGVVGGSGGVGGDDVRLRPRAGRGARADPPSWSTPTRSGPVSTASSGSTWSTACGGTRSATRPAGSAPGRCVTRCRAARAGAL